MLKVKNLQYIVGKTTTTALLLQVQHQVNLLVYGPNRPYFKQKQKNNIIKFWPTGFL